jgi:hydroxyethylthiazole kinase
VSSDLQASFTTIVKAIGTKKPLVTLLGPGGKTPACAALVFGMGGKFTRAVAADAAELAAVSQALLVDLDQLNPETGNAITKALTTAKTKATPVVLVVTGAELVPGRRAMALSLLGKKAVAIVRGNYNECASLIGADKLPAGATAEELAELAQNLAGMAAEKFGCVFCVDGGGTVYVSDGKREVVLNNAAAALLGKVPANPVLAGAVTACCAAVALPGAGGKVSAGKTNAATKIGAAGSGEAFAAAALGQVLLGEGAVLAKHFTEKKDGPGTFAVRLVDGVYNIVQNWDVFQMQMKKME